MKTSKSYFGTIFEYAVIVVLSFFMLVGILQWYTENNL